MLKGNEKSVDHTDKLTKGLNRLHTPIKSWVTKSFLTIVVLCLSVASYSYGSTINSSTQQWVLQVGAFSDSDNANRLYKTVSDAGFTAQTVTTGSTDEQLFKVIAGKSQDQAELLDLQDSIERATGVRGIVKKGSAERVQSGEVFKQPRTHYQLAQNSSAQIQPGESTRIETYDPSLSRTPQQEIASTPGFTMGGLQILPTIGLTVGYDDNITLSNRDEIDSFFYMISPAIRVELPSDRWLLGLTAGIDFIRYTDSPIDDRDFWFLRGDWVWDISTRQNLNLFAQYSEGADRRGTGRRPGDAGLIPLELDEWRLWDMGGEWDYGAVGSRGRLVLRAGISDLYYTNNRQPTEIYNGTARLDRDWYYLGGTFYWRVAPKTSLLAEDLYTDTSYSFDQSYDSVIHSYLLGVTWNASARTSGIVKYGYMERKYDQPGKPGYKGPTWAATVNWRPRTYSLFSLTGTRSTEEPEAYGDFTLRQDVTLSWLHDWATRFGTTVDVGFGRDDIRSFDQTIRTDDLFYWGVAARYTFNPHLRFGASITSYDRDSDVQEFDYRQMIYMLTLEASF